MSWWKILILGCDKTTSSARKHGSSIDNDIVVLASQNNKLVSAEWSVGDDSRNMPIDKQTDRQTKYPLPTRVRVMNIATGTNCIKSSRCLFIFCSKEVNFT